MSDIATPEKKPYSYTALSNYRRCPYAYYLMYRKRIPRASNPAMAFGSAVHEAMERAFHKRDEGISMVELMSVVQAILNKNKIPPGLAGTFLQEASTILAQINFQSLFNGATEAESRFNITHAMPNGEPPFPFLFIVDLLAERPDRAGKGGIIWDYKTNKRVDVEEHKLQMSIYRACFMETRGYPDTHCWVYFLRHGQVQRIPTLSAPDTWSLVEGMVRDIRAEKFGPRASQHNCNKPWRCNAADYCEYYRK